MSISTSKGYTPWRFDLLGGGMSERRGMDGRWIVSVVVVVVFRYFFLFVLLFLFLLTVIGRVLLIGSICC